MATYKVTQNYTLTDADGHASVMTVSEGPVGDTTTIAQLATSSASIVSALAAVTNAKLTKRTATIVIDEAQGVGTASQYPDVEQKVSVVLANNKGSKAVFHIPAPVATDLQAAPLADVLNQSDTNVAAFITALEGLARDQGSQSYNLCLGGSLSSKRRARRISIRA